MFPTVIHDFKVQMDLLKSSYQSLNILTGGKASSALMLPEDRTYVSSWERFRARHTLTCTRKFLKFILSTSTWQISFKRDFCSILLTLKFIGTHELHHSEAPHCSNLNAERSLYISVLLKGPLCLVVGGLSPQIVTVNKLNPSKSSRVMINEQLKRLLCGYVDVQETVWVKLCPHISGTRGQVGTE